MVLKKLDSRKAFTMIELLVVIAIITLLLSILAPSLSKCMAYGRAVKSMSNMRQWGIAASAYTVDNKSCYPWEGNKDDRMGENFHRSDWWANALPPYVGHDSYRLISERAIESHTYVPLPPQANNIFVDPAAKFPADFTPDVVVGYDKYWPYEYQMFFCYVWNSELNNGPTLSYADDVEVVRATALRQTSQSVLMLEIRTTNDELDPADYGYYRGRPLLGRHRGDWKRFARRHFKGGHVVFCDGHAQRVKYDWATTNRQDSRDPDYPGGDWNKGGLIWNAFGPSLK
jgi:prepilin-type N-terminal cleavage/methylation domain-containing protein/prepilin-type processing-associated H-X9-DG protein